MMRWSHPPHQNYAMMRRNYERRSSAITLRSMLVDLVKCYSCNPCRSTM
jgi:hypothetical protein